MEPTYEAIAEWLDGYFASVNKNQGPIETVVNLRDYFTPDFQFVAFTVRPEKKPLSREDLLVLFVHPGFQEDLTPNYYVIDVKRLIAVAQFEERFTDRSSGTSWPPVQASAHYHLVPDKDRGFKIKKILFWVETFTDAFALMFQMWEAQRQEALVDLAKGYLKDRP